jgi:hypothetical protein
METHMGIQLDRGIKFANSLSGNLSAVRRERIDGVRLADWFLSAHHRTDDEVRNFMAYVAKKSYLPKWANSPKQVKAASRAIQWMAAFSQDTEGKWVKH